MPVWFKAVIVILRKYYVTACHTIPNEQVPPTLILPAHYEALLEHFTSVDFVVWLVNPLCCIILGVVIVLAFMRANVYINEGMYS